MDNLSLIARVAWIPPVSAVSVVSGPAFGGTALTVRGAGFVNLTGVESLCDFRDGRVVASFVDASTRNCV